MSGLTVSGVAGSNIPRLHVILSAAKDHILNAMKEHRDDDGLVAKARAELKKAIALLAPPRRRRAGNQRRRRRVAGT
jgi:hypothetical protein